MKTNLHMNKILLNPFEKFTETQLFVAGLLLTIGGSLLAFVLECRYDGVIAMHVAPNAPVTTAFIDNVINTVSMFITLYLLGIIINKKTRAVDVLNTVLIARSPIYLTTLGNIDGFFTGITPKPDANPFDIHLSPVDIALIFVFSLFAIALLIWFAVLLYNGFKTATNLKSTIHKVFFVIAIILAEALSTLLMYTINY